MKLNQIFYKGNRLLWLCYTVLMVMDGGLNLLLSFLLQQITDATMTGNAGTLKALCMVCLVSVLGIMVVCFLQYFAQAKFIKRAMGRYKNEVFARLLKKSRRSFRSIALAPNVFGTDLYRTALTPKGKAVKGYAFGHTGEKIL